MALLANDILTDVSLVLISKYVDTTVTATIASGSRTVTPGSMDSIYVGALLMVDIGASREVVTVASLTSTNFTATFANAHSGTWAVVGATFPEGQATSRPLFEQSEMLDYLETGQNDFLLRTRILYDRDAAVTLTAGIRTFAQPTDAIRVERMSVGGSEIPNSSQSYLDLTAPDWASETGAANANPEAWFQDRVGLELFGIDPLLANNKTADLWYSKKEDTALALDTTLIIQDLFTHYLKYYVLYKALSKDGEQRDPLRADFCYRMFTMGIFKTRKFMTGIGVLFKEFIPEEMQGAVPRFDTETFQETKR